MTNRPITPTRIIPARAALPDRPPEPDELPPWRSPAPAHPNADPHPGAHTRPGPPSEPPPHPNPNPAPAHPGPIEVRVIFAPVEELEPEPEPTLLDRIRAVAPVWKIGAALAGAVVPIPGVGYSLGGVWAYCVGEARTVFGASTAYVLAFLPLLVTGRAVARTRSLRALFACAICLIGVTGAVHWFDPITALTGVHPR
ncbi:hypothetical protein AB4225_06190 [Streptomyces sp. 2RAF24]|uniref:hypothetical protein n=1 Tax=Streptomyces sp. 2RAF24 TaxID=3232997 RepID=UPI003F9935F8